MQHGGVGFAIRTKLMTSVCESPCAISPRLLRFQLNLEGGHVATLFSCYAPTLAATQEEKEQFYEQLSSATNAVPFIHQLFIRGDFNARVGKDFKVKNKILGHHGISGVWPAAGKCFRGAHWLMCEQNEAGLLSTVPPRFL